MAGPNGAFLSGKGSRIQIAGVNLTQGEYDWEVTGGDLDTTNFESGGYDQGIIGILGMTWNLSGLWDMVQLPIFNPPGIFPRSDLLLLRFYTNVTLNNFSNLPVARVLSAKNGSQVRDKVTFGASGKSNGTFTTS